MVQLAPIVVPCHPSTAPAIAAPLHVEHTGHVHTHEVHPEVEARELDTLEEREPIFGALKIARKVVGGVAKVAAGARSGRELGELAARDPENFDTRGFITTTIPGPARAGGPDTRTMRVAIRDIEHLDARSARNGRMGGRIGGAGVSRPAVLRSAVIDGHEELDRRLEPSDGLRAARMRQRMAGAKPGSHMITTKGARDLEELEELALR
ncbi:unnamed protein product [Cyclocybe aegerita]|uniref:Uncharacterized protein n=1 Tax=Cyclocybe aegerita TaxID=1973307 RepID=A0A8S0W6N4_CYCAE|nr:unnamed protein product [Cyclocybe aegerita]